MRTFIAKLIESAPLALTLAAVGLAGTAAGVSLLDWTAAARAALIA
jgi:hypothetical protein